MVLQVWLDKTGPFLVEMFHLGGFELTKYTTWLDLDLRRIRKRLLILSDTICNYTSKFQSRGALSILASNIPVYRIQNGEPPTVATSAAIFQEICYTNKDALT